MADCGPDPIIFNGGLALEILSECRRGMPHVPADQLNWVPADPELLKRIYDRRLSEAGVTVLFDTVVAAVRTARGTDCCRSATQVIAANKAGLTAYAARFFVDCTGDADVAVRAGAQAMQGEPDNRLALQPVSLCFVICNIDEYAMRHGPNLHAGNPQSPIYAILRSGRYPEIRDNHLCYTQIGPCTWTFNAGHIWDIDGTDPAAVSTAVMEGRRIADAFHRALKEFAPAAFANSFLVATAPRLGVRETRRIVGEYHLTVDDYLARRTFPDDVARNNYWIDLHTTKTEIAAAQNTDDHIVNRFEHFGRGESHGIPYRCMVPKGVANVLVAGRAISGDRYVLGATRTMPVSMNLGEAAGTAVAQLVASSTATDVRGVDIAALRADLLRHGAYLPSGKLEERVK